MAEGEERGGALLGWYKTPCYRSQDQLQVSLEDGRGL